MEVYKYVNFQHKKHPNLMLYISSRSMLFSFLLIFFGIPVCTENMTFEFNSFFPNMRDILLEGDAYASSQVIQITSNERDKAVNESIGRATYKEPMHLWDNASGTLADFSTYFTFVIDSRGDLNYGDGFAFFLSPNGSHLLPNSGGGNLGLVSTNKSFNSLDTRFLAVEFDTFQNDWDNVSYGATPHVGIDLNSVESIKDVEWWWSDIENGQTVEAWISYNSSTKNLSVLLTEDGAMDLSGNFTWLYWTVDLRNYLPEWVTFGFSGATGSDFETHSIISWNFSSMLQIPVESVVTTSSPVASNPSYTPVMPSPTSSVPRRKEQKIWLWVVLGAGACISIVALAWFGCWVKMMKRNRRDNKDDTMPMDYELERVAVPRKFSYKELVLVTSNFAEEGLLGEGGFGRVYKGFLSDINSTIAVKRITPDSRQGMKEYASEVKTISGLRHRNLVQLIGWCHEKKELLIVYEFMPNKSLDFHLFEAESSLTWERRYRIALGLASALFYMQEDCEQCVLHRDIKSSNVLLDLNFNSKLGDFGLARLVDHGEGSETTVLIGTRGYMAPEYLETGKIIKESDVYSFGVVALEIACGRRAIEPTEENGKRFEIKLVDHVWAHYGRGNVLEIADPRLSGDYIVEEMECMIIVGLWCAHPDYNHRPSIRQAMDVLNFKSPLPSLPESMPVPVPPAYSSPQGIISITGSERGQTQFSGFSSNAGSSKFFSSSSAASGGV